MSSLTDALPVNPALLTHVSSSPPSPNPDLVHVYQRFLDIPAVSRWLLTRDSGTDFLSVRLEDSVLINLSSASHPVVLPSSIPKVPVGNVHDLLFLDHVVDGSIALGHIWGKPGDETHPLAHVPQRVSIAGWEKLKCRRFATNLKSQDFLERVEFAWFTNNQLVVTVSRAPNRIGSQIMAETEVYFYDSVPLHSAPQRAALVTARIRDVQLCTFCRSAPKGECKCLNNTDALMFPVSPPVTTSTASHSFALAPAVQCMSWQNYLNSLMGSKRNGFLTCIIATKDSRGEPIERARVMHAYNLTFGTQGAINEGIHLRLKQMLLARPPMPHVAHAPLTEKIDWRRMRPKPENERDRNPASSHVKAEGQHNAGTSKAADDTSGSNSQTPAVPPPWPPDSAVPLSDCTEQRTPQPKPKKGEVNSDVAVAASIESIPSLPIAVELGKKRRLESSLCAPERQGKDRDCSAETTPNPFLSTILNTSDKDAANTTTLANFAEMSALLPPAPVPNAQKSANTLFSSAHSAFAESLSLGFTPPAGDKSGGSIQNCILPSPISMILDLNAESAKKKPRLGSSRDDGIIGNSFDPQAAAWDGSLGGDNERQRRQRDFSWSLPDRSLIGLPRPYGVENSPFGKNLATPSVLLGELRPPTPGSRIEPQQAFMRRDANEPRTGVQCEECGATFSKRANLVRHTKTVHNNIKPFGCVTCGSRFGLKADLQRHMRNIHEKRAFCCRICGRSYAEQEELDFHNRVAHEKDLRPFECPQCGMRFGRRSSRRRHEQTVHTDKRFKCGLCDKSYSQRFDMIKHRRKVHGVDVPPPPKKP